MLYECSLTQRVWTPRPVTPPQPQRTERTAADLWLARPTPPPPPPPSPPGGSTDLSKFGPLSPQVLKIISPPSDAESLDSLSPTHLSKRKSQFTLYIPAASPGDGMNKIRERVAGTKLHIFDRQLQISDGRDYGCSKIQCCS